MFLNSSPSEGWVRVPGIYPPTGGRGHGAALQKVVDDGALPALARGHAGLSLTLSLNRSQRDGPRGLSLTPLSLGVRPRLT